MKWFEDHTNHDATYTRRNAIRQLLSASPPLLPKALQRDSLVSISQSAEVRNRTVREAALCLLARCKLSLNARTGTLNFALPHDHLTLWVDIPKPVQMQLLIEIAEMVSPSPKVETRQMHTVFRHVFSAGKDEIPTFTSAGLMWKYRGKQEWTLDREPFMTQKMAEVTELEVVEHDWSKWKLWDGRWWIRVQTPTWVKSCYVRALLGEDMQAVKMMAAKRKMKSELEEVLKELKMGIRFTVPAVFWEGEGEGTGEVLVGLPTVGLILMNTARFQVRFKG